MDGPCGTLADKCMAYLEPTYPGQLDQRLSATNSIIIITARRLAR